MPSYQQSRTPVRAPGSQPAASAPVEHQPAGNQAALANLEAPEEGAGLLADVGLGLSNFGHDVAEGIGLETEEEAALGRLDAFIGHGVFGPTNLVPPAGFGGFGASFDPQAQVLFIEVKLGVYMLDGLTLSGGVALSSHTDLDDAAVAANNIADPAARQAFVDSFTWTDKGAWLTDLESRVAAAWGGRFAFQCAEPYWEALGASVAVDLDVHEGAAAGADHLQVSTYKVPETGEWSVGAYVSGPDSETSNAAMVLSSQNVENGPDVPSLLSYSVYFDNNSADLDASMTSGLDGVITSVQDANSDGSNPVELTGHASSTGSAKRNAELATQRVDAVAGYMRSNGLNNFENRVATQSAGSENATEGPEWRRVDIVIAGGQGQFVAAHEFGHVFGLGDEYAVDAGGIISGTGGTTGSLASHDAMAKQIGVPGAITENNDNLMSLGSVVRPQHYATFGWALRAVTGVDKWSIRG